MVQLDVNAAGEITVEEGAEESGLAPPKIHAVHILAHKPDFVGYAVLEKDFNRKILGAKSNNLKGLKNKLPNWIECPESLALPFGVFESVVAENKNKEIASHYNEIFLKVDQAEAEAMGDLLRSLRKAVLALSPPDGLKTSLFSVMETTGIALPKNWEDAWMCIKRVWASKWNERAFLSRRAQGIRHGDLFMAVLIQEVIDADYCFVIHTVNPFTGDRDEIYAELVTGLGETLVGNYPGRAFGFSLKKGEEKPHIHAYSSKSIGMFGGGLIFRSDSNGEDLVHYAGAGLYDSIMLPEPREIVLDYSEDPLVRDQGFQEDLLTTIADIGIRIENLMGSPQDIEGVYSKGRWHVVQTRPQV
jgi:alpha-glucan,water dikinase